MATPTDTAPVGIIMPYKARRYNEDNNVTKPTGPRAQKAPRRSPQVRPLGKRTPRG